jgi:hypothetical protein
VSAPGAPSRRHVRRIDPERGDHPAGERDELVGRRRARREQPLGHLGDGVQGGGVGEAPVRVGLRPRGRRCRARRRPSPPCHVRVWTSVWRAWGPPDVPALITAIGLRYIEPLPTTRRTRSSRRGDAAPRTRARRRAPLRLRRGAPPVVEHLARGVLPVRVERGMSRSRS